MEGDLRCRLHTSCKVKLIEGLYLRKFTLSSCFSSDMYCRAVNLRIGEQARLIKTYKYKYIRVCMYVYLTIILRGRAGYEMIYNQRGA